MGACMLSVSAVRKVADFLTPEMFYQHGHACIWRAIVAIERMGAEPNILSVTQYLRSEKTLEVAGSPHYISTLTNRVASDGSVDYHARIVQQKYISRRLILSCEAAIKAAYDDSDCFDVLDIVEGAVDACKANLAPNVLGTAADDGSALVDGHGPKYIRFNTPDLADKVMCQNGLVHVFAGRTGMGKSILSTEEAWGWTTLGRVLMFSPEMTKRQITSRILARESGVPYTKILHRQMSEQEQDTVAATWHRIGDRMKRLLIDPTSAVTPQRIRSIIQKQKSEGIVAVVIDHLHDMSSGHPKIDNDASQRGKVAYCISHLNETAKECDVPMMVMAQLNRDTEKREDKRPKLSDLLWAGDIEQKAAVIGLLYRAGYYAAEKPMHDELEIGIAKYRDGGPCVCKSPITPALSRIGSAPMSVAYAANADNRIEPKCDEPF